MEKDILVFEAGKCLGTFKVNIKNEGGVMAILEGPSAPIKNVLYIYI